jgi:hypothetical protein
MRRRRQQQLRILSASIRSGLATLCAISESEATQNPTSQHNHRHVTPTAQRGDDSENPCEICGSLRHDPTECPEHDVIYDDPSGPPRPRAPNEPRPGRPDQMAIPRAVAASILTHAEVLYNLYATETVANVRFTPTRPMTSVYDQAVSAATSALLRLTPRPTALNIRMLHPSTHPTLELLHSGIFPRSFPDFATDVAGAFETELHGHRPPPGPSNHAAHRN